jgi:ABC-type branched-subunit amino acid transport system substrate-binding protein
VCPVLGLSRNANGCRIASRPQAASRALALLSSLWLAACETTAGLGGPSINTGAAVPVALLVPQSGPGDAPALSRSLENAARLAMGDLQGARIDLRVYDTGGQPQQSAAAAVQAVQDGAKIIIGPVFAQDAAAAGRAVAPRGINVFPSPTTPPSRAATSSCWATPSTTPRTGSSATPWRAGGATS